MMVSIQTVVFPVCRSPITNSRWPRPIGIIASIAFTPVCSGSFTGCRKITPGALRSSGISKVSPDIAPFPSIGFPRVSTTRPTIPSPTLMEEIRWVRLTVSPSPTCFEGPRSTTPTLSSSRFSTIPSRPPSNSTSSPYWALESP